VTKEKRKRKTGFIKTSLPKINSGKDGAYSGKE